MKRAHEVRFPDKFWRRATHLSMDAKGLYAVLATFADYKTGETFVSNPRLQLETGHGIVKVKALLVELEKARYIERRREFRGNLKAKRHIRCLKYISAPMVQIPSSRADGIDSVRIENDATIFTSVKSSVTPEEQEDSSFPHRAQKPVRIM
jgi:helix-turn-helix protein